MAQPLCPQCGSPHEPGDQFCMKCGAKTAPAVFPAQPAVMSHVQPQATGGSSRKIILFVAIGVVSMLVLFGGIFLLMRFLGGDEPEPTEAIRETTTAQIETEPTEDSDVGTAISALPQDPTFFTSEMLDAAAVFASDELTGEYQGIAVIRKIENANQLDGIFTDQEIRVMETVLGRELPASMHYDGNSLLMFLELPQLGEIFLDEPYIDLSAQAVYVNLEATPIADFIYRILTLPEADTIRLIARSELISTVDVSADIHIEFDVLKVPAGVPEPTIEPEPTLEDPEQDEQLLMSGDIYVPTPGRVYVFDHYYVSGEYGIEEVYIGQTHSGWLSSSATYYVDAQDDFLVDRYDYVSRADGVYIRYDEYDEEILWLPHDYEASTQYTNGWADYEIVAVDVTFETGIYTFEDCIVRTMEIPEAEYFITEYLAPGHGVIHSEYSGELDAMTLINWYEDDISVINEHLKDEYQP